MQDAELHAEEFIHLIDLSHDSVLVAWGAFWFRRHSPEQRWEIVDDHDLFSVAGRRTCIGNSAEPFGESRVEVLDPDGKVAATASTSDRSWVWLTGLESDTDYRYRVLIDGREWAKGERWDSVPTPRGGYDLEPAGNQYDLRFRTWPCPDVEAERTRFVAIGDYGVGVRSDSESSRRQRRSRRRCSTSPRKLKSASSCRWGTTSTRASRGRSTTRAGERTTTGTPASSSPTAT